MNVIDIPDVIIQKIPDDVATLLQEPLRVHDMLIKKIEFQLYRITRDNKPSYVIVAYLDMNEHTVQMTYDEGLWKEDVFTEVVNFITSQLGISAIILRARILLDAHMNE
ncbi:MAG: hypothetical protein F4Y82_05380 [Cenarchaeum sp. SB0665_bin_23]|nr:hypothetical protein [Cenarchaeum sp. SB0665_bin_23]MYC79399.1 hypothetical protein [Cenarchaeum sp. SB0661_bin_35]